MAPSRHGVLRVKSLRLTQRQIFADGHRAAKRMWFQKSSVAYQQYRHGSREDVGDGHGPGYGVGRRSRLRGDDRSVGGADHDRRRGVDCMGSPGRAAMDFTGGGLTNGDFGSTGITLLHCGVKGNTPGDAHRNPRLFFTKK
jgi:hypothetical protein